MLLVAGLLSLVLGVFAENNLTATIASTPAQNVTEEAIPVVTNIPKSAYETNQSMLKPVHEPQEQDHPRVIQTSQTQHAFGRVQTAPTLVDVQKGFRPSQQLDTVYEFNRFPVEPAHPESKHLAASLKIPTLAKEESERDGWTSKVRFPTHGPQPVTVDDHPYPYLKESDHNAYYHTIPKAFHDGGGYPNQYQTVRRPTGHNWDMTSKRKPPSKTFYEEHSYATEVAPSPWKKLIKLLTAFIPIGILFSALTPSIITIGPMNGTARGRSGGKSSNANPLLPEVPWNGCDERIFCELMLSAQESGKGHTQSIEAMLDNYTHRHGEYPRYPDATH